MNILALDTASAVLSAALQTETGIWHTEIDAGTRHSELLMECTDWLCKSAGLPPDGIGMVACMKGPGSFTGLRIGFSAAKGIALALGIPLATVPTLDCLAYPFSVWPGLVLPALDARKNSFYAALYRPSGISAGAGDPPPPDDDAPLPVPLSGYMDAPAAALAEEAARLTLPGEPILLTGPGAGLLYPALRGAFPPGLIRADPEPSRGRARELLNIVKSSKFKIKDGLNSGPVYLRKSDAELNFG